MSIIIPDKSIIQRMRAEMTVFTGSCSLRHFMAVLTDSFVVIHTCLTMATASVRDLRNHFPKIKKIVESQGEVIVTDKGQPKYKLTLFTPGQSAKTTLLKDYMARLRRHQLRPISAAAAKSLHDENRGSR